MIWEGCGECKYCWPTGEYGERIYCTPRERECDEHFAGYRDKECGLVEAITIGNLKKLIEGLDDSLMVDVWFHKSLLFLGKDEFFGTGTLDELYTWKRYEDFTEQEKKEFNEMFLQRNPESFKSSKRGESDNPRIAYMECDPRDLAYHKTEDLSGQIFVDFSKLKEIKDINIPEVKELGCWKITIDPSKACINEESKDKEKSEDRHWPLTQEEYDADPDLPGYLNPKYSMTDEEYQEYLDSIMTREEQKELSRRFIEAKKNNTDIDLKSLLEGKKENK